MKQKIETWQRNVFDAIQRGEKFVLSRGSGRGAMKKYYQGMCEHNYQNNVLVISPEGKYISEVCFDCRHVKARR